MADQVETPGTAPIVDRRPVPRGVLPKGVQTWLMVALAVGMLGIIFLTGRPEGSATPGQSTQPAASPTADRVREYQDRLRMLDAQAARELQQTALDAQSAPTPSTGNDRASAPVDPLAAERQRREYESLFASNVVLSRRSEDSQPDAGRRVSNPSTDARPTPGEPSIDDIADAVVRATTRTAGTVTSSPPAAPQAVPPGVAVPSDSVSSERQVPQPTPRISAVGPLHRVLEGTVIDTVLTNRLDGTTAAPVNCLVTNPLYSHSGQQVLIPAGARVLGETRPVESLGQTRLAVVFHRVLMPDGSTVPLNQFKGLNQIGESGLRDQVNQHYLSTFGAAGAVGLVSGLSQFLGNAAFGVGDGNRTVVLAGSTAESTAQASSQVMNRFLNRLPTITIREGHRVKVYITSDLDLPEWSPLSAVAQMPRR